MPRRDAVVFVHGVGPLRKAYEDTAPEPKNAFWGPFFKTAAQSLKRSNVDLVPVEANWSAHGFTFTPPPGGPEYAEIDPDGPAAGGLTGIEMVRVLVHRKLKVWAEERTRPSRCERSRDARTAYVSRDGRDVIIENVAAKTFALLLENMGDAWVYLTDPAGHGEKILAVVREAIEKAAGAGAGRIHVVAHSLGTVVAYDVLREMAVSGESAARRRVSLFMTMGSPLQNIRRLKIRRGGASGGEEVAVPGYDILDATVDRWVNVYDAQDVVGEALVGEGFALPPVPTEEAGAGRKVNVLTDSGDNPYDAHDQWADEAAAGLFARLVKEAR